jgi:very-short-patch-repair endonuclease
MAVFYEEDQDSPFKCPKPIKRHRPDRGVPKTRAPRHRDNPFKSQYARWPSEKREEWERKAQAQNLTCKSQAREALCSALRGLGIECRKEERVRAFCNTYFIDVWCPTLRIGWECDGAGHRNSHPRDRGRGEDIAKVMNCRMIRRWNRWYLTGDLKQKILVIIGEGDKHAFS